MSIETEFESTITNVKNAYQGLDNLGATIPQNKTIENIKSCLDEIYAKFPKTSYAEGSNITLSNTLKGKLDFEDGIVGYGDTKQEGAPTPETPIDIEVVRGKNILKFKANNTQTSSGITATTNISSITLNGTSNAQVNIACEIEPIKVKGTYRLSGYTRNDNYVDLYYKDSGGTIKLVHCKDNPTITFNEGDTLFEIFIFIASSTTATFNNETFNLQLEKGSQASSYLPYNTLEVVERGKNEANIGNVVEGYVSGADGSIVSSSTNNEGTIAFIKVKPNTAYTFKIFETSWASFGTSNWFAFAQFTTNNTSGFISRTTSSNSSQDYFTITTSSTTQYVSISARGLLSATKVQLEENNQATTYEPYQTPQTYQLSLGDKELYTDSEIVRVSKNNFKFVDKWKKIFIDSNDIEGISKGCAIISHKYFIDIADVGIYQQDIVPPILSNIDKSEKWSYINNNDDLSGKMFLLKLTESQNQFRLYLNATTVQEAKTNLDNSNAYFIYKAITPIETPITDTTLINQLENFYNSQSFNGTTIIEIDGQLPLIIKVRALKGE